MTSHPLALAVALAVSFALVGARPIWRTATRYAVAVVHEAGHAIVAVVLVRQLPRIRLEADASGTTRCKVHRGLGGLLVAMAGYPAPGLAGVVEAVIVRSPHAALSLVVPLVLGIIEWVLAVRNAFGWLVMAGWVAGTALALAYAPSGADRGIGTAIAATLVLAGARSAWEIAWHPQDGSDVDSLHCRTYLPAGFLAAGLLVVVAAELGAVAFVLVAPHLPWQGWHPALAAHHHLALWASEVGRWFR